MHSSRFELVKRELLRQSEVDARTDDLINDMGFIQDVASHDPVLARHVFNRQRATRMIIDHITFCWEDFNDEDEITSVLAR